MSDNDDNNDNPLGGGNVPDLGSIMNMAQRLQGDVEKMQDDLEKVECEAASGGGMVTAVVNGKYEVVRLKVEKEVVDPEDIEMLQDLVIAAVNQAIVKVRDKAQVEMGKLTGGLSIPGLTNL